MQVTLHVYPKLIGSAESLDQVDLFIVIDEQIRPWFGLRGFASDSRIIKCVEMLRMDHGVELRVIEHQFSYYTHLPRHDLCDDGVFRDY